MKMIVEYLERVVQFERMAAEATDAALKASLEKQAAAYRKLAEKRAAEIKLQPVNLPAMIEPKDRPL